MQLVSSQNFKAKATVALKGKTNKKKCVCMYNMGFISNPKRKTM